MKQMVGLVILLVAAAVLLSSCGTQRVGEMQRESQMVDLENAQSAETELRMGAGELDVSGGADALMEADFAYNVSDWKPKVRYDVSADEGELVVKQGGAGGSSLSGETRNEWEIRLNDEVPTDLVV
jgi:hypothetical protein